MYLRSQHRTRVQWALRSNTKHLPQSHSNMSTQARTAP